MAAVAVCAVTVVMMMMLTAVAERISAMMPAVMMATATMINYEQMFFEPEEQSLIS